MPSVRYKKLDPFPSPTLSHIVRSRLIHDNIVDLSANNSSGAQKNSFYEHQGAHISCLLSSKSGGLAAPLHQINLCRELGSSNSFPVFLTTHLRSKFHTRRAEVASYTAWCTLYHEICSRPKRFSTSAAFSLSGHYLGCWTSCAFLSDSERFLQRDP